MHPWYIIAISGGYLKPFIVCWKYRVWLCWNRRATLGQHIISICTIGVDSEWWFFHPKYPPRFLKTAPLYFGEVAVFPFWARCRIVICPSFFDIGIASLIHFELQPSTPICLLAEFAISLVVNTGWVFTQCKFIVRGASSWWYHLSLGTPAMFSRLHSGPPNYIGRNHALHVKR